MRSFARMVPCLFGGTLMLAGCSAAEASSDPEENVDDSADGVRSVQDPAKDPVFVTCTNPTTVHHKDVPTLKIRTDSAGHPYISNTTIPTIGKEPAEGNNSSTSSPQPDYWMLARWTPPSNDAAQARMIHIEINSGPAANGYIVTTERPETREHLNCVFNSAIPKFCSLKQPNSRRMSLLQTNCPEPT